MKKSTLSVAMIQALAASAHPFDAIPLGDRIFNIPTKKKSHVIGTVHIGNDKQKVYRFRQKMTPKQIKAIRRATGGNRTTHVLMRAKSQLGG